MNVPIALPPELVFAFEVCAPLDVGDTPRGHRKIIPITGGTLQVPGIEGRIPPGGSDWQIVRPDGVIELHARYTVEISGNGLLYTANEGIRDAAPEMMATSDAGESLDNRSTIFELSRDSKPPRRTLGGPWDQSLLAQPAAIRTTCESVPGKFCRKGAD